MGTPKEWYNLHAPVPQQALVMTIFVRQHVKTAAAARSKPPSLAAEGGASGASRAGLSARRMSTGGTRTVTCASTWVSQQS